jgi:hypothetical protein
MLNREFEGKVAVSDSPSWDGGWTKMLFDAVGTPAAFGYNDYSLVANTFGKVYDRRSVARFHPIMEAIDRLYPHTHKADEDALRMGAMTRAMLDFEWAGWVLERTPIVTP